MQVKQNFLCIHANMRRDKNCTQQKFSSKCALLEHASQQNTFMQAEKKKCKISTFNSLNSTIAFHHHVLFYQQAHNKIMQYKKKKNKI